MTNICKPKDRARLKTVVTALTVLAGMFLTLVALNTQAKAALTYTPQLVISDPERGPLCNFIVLNSKEEELVTSLLKDLLTIDLFLEKLEELNPSMPKEQKAGLRKYYIKNCTDSRRAMGI